MSLEFQFIFDRPLSVSQGKELDEVFLYFRTNQGKEGRGKEEWHKIVCNLPLQLPSETAAQSLDQMADNLDKSSQMLFWIIVCANLFLSFALGMLWATFQTLQVIIAMPLL